MSTALRRPDRPAHREALVKAALQRQLSQTEDDDALIRPELGLLGAARIDVAVVNGSLVGYEIKSSADRLDRLPGQATVYGRVFDRVVLVCDQRHLVRARGMIPAWWGVWRVDGDAEAIRFGRVKAGRVNPSVDALAVAQLLWRDEALMLLEMRGLADGLRTATRWALWAELADRLPRQELQVAVREQLKARVWS